MPFTVRTASDNLISYLEPAQRVMPPGTDADDPFPAVLDCIHGTLQELACLGPVFQFRDRRSFVVKTPIQLNTVPLVAGALTFTHGSVTAALVGCSISVSGVTEADEPWNEIVSVTGTTATVRNPFLTTNASSLVNVFFDSYVLPSDVIEVFKPVTISDRYDLEPVSDVGDLNSALYENWNDPERNGIATGVPIVRAAGTPRFYFVDGRWTAATPDSKRLKLAPMPTLVVPCILSYTARIAPPHFVRADIYGGTPANDPGTLIPFSPNLVESVFMPICRQRWTASPFMDNSSATAEINRQYQVAYTIIAAMFPQMRGVKMPKIATPAPAAAAPQQGAQ